jgi:hypothetical protein
MAGKRVFECESCGKRQEVADAGAPAPRCCGRYMTDTAILNQCRISSTAEHSRLDNPDDACDDGRSG